MQIPHAVTTVNTLEVDCVIACLVERVPFAELVWQRTGADVYSSVIFEGSAHLQVQMNQAVTAVGSLNVDVIVASFRIAEIFVVVPKEWEVDVTYIDDGVDGVGQVHRQVQGNGAVAAVDGAQILHVREFARLRGGHIEAVLCKGFTDAKCGVQSGFSRLENQKVKNRETVAVVYVIVVLGIVVTFCWMIDVKSLVVERDIVTSVGSDSVNFFRENCQLKRDDAVTSSDGL